MTERPRRAVAAPDPGGAEPGTLKPSALEPAAAVLTASGTTASGPTAVAPSASALADQPGVPTPPASPVGSVDKALVLLGLLAEAGPEGAPLGELARASGFTKASVHRLLQALAHRGYAEADAVTHDYRMGTGPAQLVDRFYDEENLPALLRPALAAVSQRAHELVHLGILSGASVVYLDKVEPQRTLRVWSRIGHSAPAARTALGRALLAAEPIGPADLDIYLDASRELLPVSPRGAARPEAASPTPAAPDPRPGMDSLRPRLSAARLTQVLADARRRGWSEEDQENEAGISCVGVALVRPHGRALAVSVTGPSERMTAEHRAELGAMMREELARRAPAGFEPVPLQDAQPSAQTDQPAQTDQNRTDREGVSS